MLNYLRRSKKNVATIKKVQKMPELDDFLTNQDYEGAISLLNHKIRAGNLDSEQEDSLQLWLAHCYYRLRKFEEAATVYNVMLENENAPQEIRVYLACCKFYLKQYAEAKKIAAKCPKTPLFIRLMMNVSLRLNDEKGILSYHGSLGSSLEDNLALAGVHFSRMHYKDAIAVYQEILARSPNLIGLNIPLAICYAKQDLPAVAYNLVKNYLRSFPNSPFAKNLLISVVYRTISSKTTLDENSDLARNVEREGALMVAELEALLKQKLYPEVEYLCRHNLVLARNCDNALQVLPSLMKHVPEARMNLVLYHLNNGNLNDAMGLVKDVEPVNPHEFLAKALTFLEWGKRNNSRDHLKMAEKYFQIVGDSELVQDTIVGRQAAAAYMFLAFKFDDVITYLESVADFFTNNDAFLLNLAQAFFMYKNYRAAEDHFVRVSGPERDKILFKLMLLRCYVRNKELDKAWGIIEKPLSSTDKLTLIKLLANEAYACSEYYDAALAFHELEKQDPSPENWQGKRGACAALFRLVAMNYRTEPKYTEQLRTVMKLIQENYHSNCDFLISTIQKWGVSHNVDLTLQ